MKINGIFEPYQIDFESKMGLFKPWSRMLFRSFQYLKATQIETFGAGQWASHPWNYLISVIADKNIGAITRQTFEKVAFNKLLKRLK